MDSVPICDETGKVRPLDDIQRDVVRAVLVANEGDKQATARELGIVVKTLYTWLHRWAGTKPKPHKKKKSR